MFMTCLFSQRGARLKDNKSWLDTRQTVVTTAKLRILLYYLMTWLRSDSRQVGFAMCDIHITHRSHSFCNNAYTIGALSSCAPWLLGPNDGGDQVENVMLYTSL